MSDFPPLIYAELLATLRQVSLSILFPSPLSPSTSLVITCAGRRLELTHAAHRTTLLLPAAVHCPSPLPLPLPSGSPTHAHWRLPLAAAASAPPHYYAHAHQDVPWEARDLVAGAAVDCRACGAHVVAPQTVRAWKDLPSENWAEMMEFWHCHKPHVPPAQGKDGASSAADQSLAQRAYGANATIAAQQGVGFVDLTSFLFVDGDVENVKFTHSPSATPHPQSFARPAPAPVFCAACNTRIGSHDAQLASTVLFKWRVATQSAVAPPPSTVCLAGSLLAGMSRSGYSKSILLPAARTISSAAAATTVADAPQEQRSAKPLYLWIMNPNTMYSATGLAEAQPAIRIMYKFIARAEADKLLDNASSDVQEVIWPSEAIDEAVATLDKAYDVMPPEARAFQDWKVSMLDKWQRPT